MTKIVDFVPEHAIDLIEMGRANFGVLHDADTTMKPYFQVIAEDSAYTMMEDGHLVGAAGIYRVWDGVGEAWLLPSERLLARPRKAVKAVRQFLDDIAERENFRRVQATTHADFHRGRRFLEWLGFEKEGLLRGYGPDVADHIMFARISNGTTN